MDVRQIRALTRFTLLSEWRQASLRLVRGRRKKSRLWAYGAVVMYLLGGAVLMRLFSAAATPEAYVVSVSIFALYLCGLTASNILLSFGAGFLSPDEASMIDPLPVSSTTFFLSRLTVLIFYSTAISLLVSIGPFVSLAFLRNGIHFRAAFAMLISAGLSCIASALAVIVLYGLLLRRLSKAALARVLGYAQFLGSFLIAGGFVILPRIGRQFDLARWTPAHAPWIRAVPASWFGSLASLLNGDASEMPLAIAAIVFTAILALLANVLLGKHYQGEVAKLSASSQGLAKGVGKRPGIIYRIYLRFARTHEARAIFMVLRAQFRFDTKFRMGMLAIVPLTILYLGLAVIQGGVRDPFTASIGQVVSSQFLYMVAMIMPLMLLQAVTQSENYKAAWLFFALPAARERLLLALRNTIVTSIFIPYIVLLAIVFSYFMPAVHAVEHALVLGAIGGMVFQFFLLFQAKMPFAQPRRPNQRGVWQILGYAMLVWGPMALLALEVLFGYRSAARYWSSFALLVTLIVLTEFFVHSRVKIKLDREEFEG